MLYATVVKLHYHLTCVHTLVE